jgi:hypothetical protein
VSIERAVDMANLLLRAREQHEAALAECERLKAAVVRIEQVDLPELMQEMGLSSFKLQSGETVDLTQDVSCGISEAVRPSAHHWLIEHGFGGLIKAEVKVSFDRGDITAAQVFAATNGGELIDRVHPSTLKTFVKERMEAGDMPPEELFGIHPFHRVKIAAPKKR